jgi:hypothetical protein
MSTGYDYEAYLDGIRSVPGVVSSAEPYNLYVNRSRGVSSSSGPYVILVERFRLQLDHIILIVIEVFLLLRGRFMRITMVESMIFGVQLDMGIFRMTP